MKRPREKKNILVVEDNPADTRLITELMGDAEETIFSWDCVDRLSLAISLDRAMEILRSIRLAICFYPRSSQPVRKVCCLGSTEQKLLTALDLKVEPVR